MHLKRLFILFIVISSSYLANSQETNSLIKGLHIETQYGYGFVMPHHKSIEYFLEDHIQTIDIKISKATFGNKYWNQLYRYPYYGIGFYRSNLGNDDIFGHANAIYSFVKVPFLGASNKINLSYQMSFGASYLTKHFDIEENYENLAIGSHLNIFIGLSLQSKIPLSKRLALTNGIRITHFSNGITKAPNKGLNVFTGSVGLIYQINPVAPEKITKKLPDVDSKNEYSVIYAAGVKSISRYEDESYFVSSVIFDFNRNYSQKGRWLAGIDLFYNASNIEFSNKTDKSNIVNSDLYQLGIHAGHDLVFGKFAIVLNIGGYIYAPIETLAPIYSRTGIRYRINNKIITNITLKSHWAKASFIEWGVGYVF
jgi:hypothetical protein